MNLVSLMSLSKAELKTKIETIDASAVKGRGLRRKLETMKRKQGGFTLLELLVVVAILAAIAGTATTLLHDTDRKANAAAHVAMMDELAKGIQTFYQLNAQQYPNNWDSLLSSPTGTLTGGALSVVLNADLAANLELATPVLTTDEVAAMNAVGLKDVRVLDASIANCANVAAGTANSIIDNINSKANDVTPQNIFRTAAANGCGAALSAAITGTPALVMWKSAQNPRVNATTTERLVAFGVGPDSTLFKPTNYGALTNVPVYRHTAAGEYNRFIVLFNVTSNATSPTNGKAVLQAIIDGAGDTKDEELGEFDNVRST